MGTLKPQSNGPLYINTVIDTLAVDGWAVTLGTAHPSTASVPTSYRPIPCLQLETNVTATYAVVEMKDSKQFQRASFSVYHSIS